MWHPQVAADLPLKQTPTPLLAGSGDNLTAVQHAQLMNPQRKWYKQALMHQTANKLQTNWWERQCQILHYLRTAP
jgi:hypothetical protein